MTTQQTAEPKYTCRRSTDGCDETFDIIHPNGWDIIATRPFCGEEVEQAMADIELIVRRLNCHTRLLAACRMLVQRLKDRPDLPQGSVYEFALAAIAEAEAA